MSLDIASSHSLLFLPRRACRAETERGRGLEKEMMEYQGGWTSISTDSKPFIDPRILHDAKILDLPSPVCHFQSDLPLLIKSANGLALRLNAEAEGSRWHRSGDSAPKGCVEDAPASTASRRFCLFTRSERRTEADVTHIYTHIHSLSLTHMHGSECDSHTLTCTCVTIGGLSRVCLCVSCTWLPAARQSAPRHCTRRRWSLTDAAISFSSLMPDWDQIWVRLTNKHFYSLFITFPFCLLLFCTQLL